MPDPQEFDAYKALEPSQKALVNQLVMSLTRPRKAARRRLYASQMLRMAAFDHGHRGPDRDSCVGAQLGGRAAGRGAALLEGSIQVFRYEERALVDIRRYRCELGELEDFLAVAGDYRHAAGPFEPLAERLSEIRHQARQADLLILSRPSPERHSGTASS